MEFCIVQLVLRKRLINGFQIVHAAADFGEGIGVEPLALDDHGHAESGGLVSDLLYGSAVFHNEEAKGRVLNGEVVRRTPWRARR